MKVRSDDTIRFWLIVVTSFPLLRRAHDHFSDVVLLNLTGLHVAVNPALEVQSRGMFLMVSPTLVLTMRPLLDPPLKLILPESPYPTHFERWNLALSG